MTFPFPYRRYYTRTYQFFLSTIVTRANQYPQLSVFKNEMEKPSHLVSQFTESDVAKTTSDLSQVTKDQISRLHIQLNFTFTATILKVFRK